MLVWTLACTSSVSLGFCRLHSTKGPQQWADVSEDPARSHIEHLLLAQDPWRSGESWILSESIPIQSTRDQSAGVQHPSGGAEVHQWHFLILNQCVTLRKGTLVMSYSRRLGLRRSGFYSRLCHRVAVWPWGSLPSLCAAVSPSVQWG